MLLVVYRIFNICTFLAQNIKRVASPLCSCLHLLYDASTLGWTTADPFHDSEEPTSRNDLHTFPWKISVWLILSALVKLRISARVLPYRHILIKNSGHHSPVSWSTSSIRGRNFSSYTFLLFWAVCVALDYIFEQLQLLILNMVVYVQPPNWKP